MLPILAGGEIGGYRYSLHDLSVAQARARSTTLRHQHLGYEVFALYQGQMTFQAEDGAELLLAPGHLLLVPAKLYHQTMREEESCLYVTLRFVTTPLLPAPLPLHVGDDPAAMREIAALLDEAETRRPGWQERARRRLDLVLSLLLAPFTPEHSYADTTTGPAGIADRVDAYLCAHLARPITVQFVAEALGLHERTLMRRFKQATGDTVMARLLALRIEAAILLLVERPELTVRQVSALVGMPDSAYFTNCFRRAMGTSPQRYRRHARAIQGRETPHAFTAP